jgi:hypothetical protein
MRRAKALYELRTGWTESEFIWRETPNAQLRAARQTLLLGQLPLRRAGATFYQTLTMPCPSLWD